MLGVLELRCAEVHAWDFPREIWLSQVLSRQGPVPGVVGGARWELVARRGWESSGCVSPVQWLWWQCGLGTVAASEPVRVAITLRDLGRPDGRNDRSGQGPEAAVLQGPNPTIISRGKGLGQ
jgi:hypothetical protein